LSDVKPVAVLANTPTPKNMSLEAEAEAPMVVWDMCTSWIYSAALRTIVQLDVPNILATLTLGCPDSIYLSY